MIRRILRIPWAGPAVVLALLFGTVELRPAWAEPVAPAPLAATAPAAPAADGFCITEAIAFGEAVLDWYQAWENYEWTVPGGTEPEILAAADQLDQATMQVVTSGTKLLLCLVNKLE
jgi:hypothetical protein